VSSAHNHWGFDNFLSHDEIYRYIDTEYKSRVDYFNSGDWTPMERFRFIYLYQVTRAISTNVGTIYILMYYTAYTM